MTVSQIQVAGLLRITAKFASTWQQAHIYHQLGLSTQHMLGEGNKAGS